MSGEEHRRAPRVSRHIIVRYRSMAEGETIWRASPLRDLSSVGGRFVAERLFQTGTVLDMQLLLPNVPGTTVLKARVVWANPLQKGMVELGVAFEPTDRITQQAIDEAVEHFLRKRA